MAMQQDFSKYQAADPRRADEVPEGVIVSDDTRRTNRMPPGQIRTRKWPILHYSSVPIIELNEWRLDVFGLVETPLSFDWKQFQALPRVRVYSDFHCVTRWSRLDNIWEGVSVLELLNLAKPLAHAKYVVAHGYDGEWTTNLPFADFNVEDALLADRHDKIGRAHV